MAIRASNVGRPAMAACERTGSESRDITVRLSAISSARLLGRSDVAIPGRPS